MTDCLRPYRLQSARLLCQWDSPGKNTGVGCHFLLQEIFLTQEVNPHLLCLLHWRQILYHWAIREAPDFQYRYNANNYGLVFCINQFRLPKLIQIRWPKKQEVHFVTILEAGSLRSGHQCGQVLVKTLWLSCICLLVVTSHGLFPVPRGWRRRGRGGEEKRKERESSVASSYKGTNLIRLGLHPHDLISP